MAELLAEMGHSPVVIGPGYHRERVARSGLPFVPVGDNEIFQQLLDHPDLWHPIKGPDLVFQMAAQAFEPYFEAIRSQAPDQSTILISPCFQPAARLARERMGCRLWTAHVQPAALLSLYDTPEMGGIGRWLPMLPVWTKRLLLQLPTPFDRAIAKTGRALCAREGVTPPRHWFKEWWNSPDGNLMLFPEWFGAPQQDWPHRSHQIGFPLYDRLGQTELEAELATFLKAGSPPIVVTFGSVMKQATSEYRAVVEAAIGLGRRVVVASEFADDLAAEFEDVLAVRYAPFSMLFKQCAAVVHHGGIGTLSQASAAGVPQWIVPFSHDQFDNARRLRETGTASTLPANQLNKEQGQRVLQPLLEDLKFQRCARSLAERMEREQTTQAFRQSVEALLRKE